ncbi:hypothetical protein NKG05_18460 [Oerskovia sp. M15]
MFYEAQVAGLPDTSPAVRLVKRASVADLGTRRGEVIAAVSDAVGHDLELVNSGGTGSLETSAGDPVVTEVTSGSGSSCPGCSTRTVRSSRTRRRSSGWTSCGSRRPVRDRVRGRLRRLGPRRTHARPTGPRARLETHLVRGRRRGPDAAARRTGPPRRPRPRGGRPRLVPPRQGGELMERFDRVQLVRGDQVVEEVPTYRGEGKNFG